MFPFMPSPSKTALHFPSRVVTPLFICLIFLLGSASCNVVTLTVTDTVISEISPSTRKLEVAGLFDCSTKGLSTLLVNYTSSIFVKFEGEDKIDLWSGTEPYGGSEVLGGTGRLRTVLLPVSVAADSFDPGSLQVISGESTSCQINAHLVSIQSRITFVIGTLANGIVWVDTINFNEQPATPEAEAEYVDDNDDFDTTPIQGQDDGSLIDLHVAYTNEALCQDAGLAFPCDYTSSAPIIARIQFFVAQTNDIFNVTRSNVRVALV